MLVRDSVTRIYRKELTENENARMCRFARAELQDK